MKSWCRNCSAHPLTDSLSHTTHKGIDETTKYCTTRTTTKQSQSSLRNETTNRLQVTTCLCLRESSRGQSRVSASIWGIKWYYKTPSGSLCHIFCSVTDKGYVLTVQGHRVTRLWSVNPTTLTSAFEFLQSAESLLPSTVCLVCTITVIVRQVVSTSRQCCPLHRQISSKCLFRHLTRHIIVQSTTL